MTTTQGRQLTKTETGCTYAVCGWPPASECPGVPRYERDQAPRLKTRQLLHESGLKSGGDRRGCIAWRDGWLWLYDEREALPRPLATSAQLAALAKARTVQLERRTCTKCGYVDEHTLPGCLCKSGRADTTAIHGISDALAAGAPPFSQIHARLPGKTVIVYNADFYWRSQR